MPPGRRHLFGGGIDGNEQLTAMTGLGLIVLLAAVGVTIVRIGQLLWLHLFLGLLVIGPVVLKMASTGYRFMRYYAHAAIYRAKGPPMPALRAMGPVLVLSTIVVLGTGLVLLFEGPRGPRHAAPHPQGELHRLARVHGHPRPRSPPRARAVPARRPDRRRRVRRPASVSPHHHHPH